MAKVGSYRWEGKEKIRKDREVQDRKEVEEFDPTSGLFSDESSEVLEDTYFELHTNVGPY